MHEDIGRIYMIFLFAMTFPEHPVFFTALSSRIVQIASIEVEVAHQIRVP